MPLTPGQRRLYAGEYNYLTQNWQADGSCILEINGKGHPTGIRMHVQDLFGQNETVLSEEVLPPGPPAWMRARLEDAQRGPPPEEPGP